MTRINYQVLTKAILLERLSELFSISIDVDHDNWKRKHYLLDLPEKWRYSLACFSDGLLLGYIIASQNETNEVRIHKYVINQLYRGKGIGEELLHKFLKNLDTNIARITLKVYKDNAGAIKFYKRHSFTVISSEKDMFQMELRII